MKKFRIVDLRYAVASPRITLVLEDGRHIPMSLEWSLSAKVNVGDVYVESAGVVERAP